jgi:hypothetical protein
MASSAPTHSLTPKFFHASGCQWCDARKHTIEEHVDKLMHSSRAYFLNCLIMDKATPLIELLQISKAHVAHFVRYACTTYAHNMRVLDAGEVVVALLKQTSSLVASLDGSSILCLLKTLPARLQLELLDATFPHEIPPALEMRFLGTICEHCLYGVMYLRRHCLLQAQSKIMEACRRLGSTWDSRLGRCLAHYLPTVLCENEDFVIGALAYVNDDRILEYILKFHDDAAQERIAAAFVKSKPLSIVGTRLAGHKDTALLALKSHMAIIDQLHASLRMNWEFLEEAASIDGAAFLATSTGRNNNMDMRVMMAALRSPVRGKDNIILPDALDYRLQADPAFMARVVERLFSAGPHMGETCRAIMAVRNAVCETDEFQRALVSAAGRCLSLLENHQRGRRELVLLAVKSDPSALQYADDSVWKWSEGVEESTWQFVADVLAAGCNMQDLPASLLDRMDHSEDSPRFPAMLLLKNRGAWCKLTPGQQAQLPDCQERICAICHELPADQVFHCKPLGERPRCNSYFCKSCCLLLTVKNDTRKCPLCRSVQQLVGGVFGERNPDSELIIQRELMSPLRKESKKRRCA